MTRKSILTSLLAVVLLLLLAVGGSQAQEPEGDISAQAAVGTAFTYQGRLRDTSGPVTGTCDVRFRLYNAASGGSLLGTDTVNGVPVSDGYFGVVLNDNGEFGGNAFNGQARWLEIRVNCGSGDTDLSPRQPLTAAPYAHYALRAPWSGLSGVPAGLNDGDDDTTYTAGTGLTLSGGAFNLAASYRLPQGCANGQIAEWNGSVWACGNDDVGSGGVTDHGALTGLGDDDHPQYFHLGQNETVSGRPNFNGGTSGSTPPFTVDSTYRVTSLNADLLDGQHASSFAGAAHDHWGESWSGSGIGLTLSTSHGTGIVGNSSGDSGIGVYGYSSGDSGHGVYGYSTSGSGYGVYGTSTGDFGFGVYGSSTGTGGHGVYGYSPDINGHGVHGSSDSGFGVYGYGGVVGVEGIGTTGVDGWSTSSSGYGVHGLNSSNSGIGIYGEASASSGQTTGVRGQSDSTSGRGVVGSATATSGTTHGVIGYSASPNGYAGFFRNTASGVALYAQSDSGSGNIIEAWSSFGDREFRVERGGNVRADGSFTGGGADYAELLPGAAGLEAGEVLVIGPEGQLSRSTKPYQTSVAGVYSTQPGFVAGAGDDSADLSGQVPLAVMGVVPVKVSSENGPIQPGDLLTSSGTPGHAMRAGQNPPVGTVIGKALEPLTDGRGIIKMLVVLQ